MSEGYEIWWIDDDESRESQARGLDEETERLTVNFFLPEEIMDRLVSDESDVSEPDLILTDWVLHQKSDFGGDGLSVEGVIRGALPEVPVYGFSARYHDSSFERKRSERRFDRLFHLSDLTEPDTAARLISDIKDYRQIEDVQEEGVDALLDLLGTPSSDRTDKLPTALPHEFTGGIPSGERYESGGILRFARWVRDELLRTPGLLWDRKLTATKLGLTEEAFQGEYMDQFEDAEYSGIFASAVGPRWWRSDIIGILIDLSQDTDVEIQSPWRSGPQILGADESEMAECVVCEETFPETVGYLSIDTDDGFPVHYRCSVIEKTRDGVFDDLRLIERD